MPYDKTLALVRFSRRFVPKRLTSAIEFYNLSKERYGFGKNANFIAPES